MLTAVGVVVALLVNRMVPGVSALIVALVLGAVLTNLGLVPDSLRPGLQAAVKTPMRAGIVLLGVSLALPDVLALGAPVLLVVLGGVAVTFLGTLLLGRLFGIARERRLLIATGVSICGASAVAAMNDSAEGDEDDVMTAVAIVTIFGTLAVLALPALRGALGLAPATFGIWTGASVHEVGQVVATAGAVGAAALAPAVIVKLTRVVLLAPLIVAVNLWQRRDRSIPAPREGGASTPERARPPIVPLFVIGFLIAVAIGSAGVLPESVLGPVSVLQTVLLSAGLFAMGTGVRLAALARSSGRSIALGALSTLLMLTVTYTGLALAT
ncbi:putative sulfate exporter family transporter [Nocardiopsis gilva YIM 90087]|uniref:Putative sulfate exporter family transporter n=1 Tax=Nocardiopsis gilva YIM 90087 TaxID=1235441 RepID=A0A223SDT0_9ACTN|nr:putative sulfate exporter family transporter [Nocardiopsis gilva YIM 90087]